MPKIAWLPATVPAWRAFLQLPAPAQLTTSARLTVGQFQRRACLLYQGLPLQFLDPHYNVLGLLFAAQVQLIFLLPLRRGCLRAFNGQLSFIDPDRRIGFLLQLVEVLSERLPTPEHDSDRRGVEHTGHADA